MRGWLPLLLVGLSAATHFIGLGQPREIIFDEVHFGKFVTAYCCTGQRFFDIHPPHAKLLIAATAKLGGYDGELSFEHIGQSYNDVSPWGFRVLPALMGTILPVIIYIILLQLGASRPAAFFGGLVVLLDNALTIQTRIIALDGILLVATFGSLAAYLAAEQAIRRAGSSVSWLGWGLLAGALAGVAVGTKFTGLLALGLLGLLFMYRLLSGGARGLVKRWLWLGLIILLSAFLVYIAGWAAHFMLLTQPGGGDAWGIPTWEPPLVASFWRETTKLHQTMYAANNGLTIAHHDSSPWWGWPFMSNPVFYWQKSSAGAPSLVAAIYFIGNPVVWIGSTLLLLIALLWAGLTLAMNRSWTAFTHDWFLIPALGYVGAFWPLTRVDRGLFLYHYATPLVFAILLGVLWLDRQGWFNRVSITAQPRRVYISVALLVLFFVLFSPLTYGWFLHPDTQKLLFWLPSWR